VPRAGAPRGAGVLFDIRASDPVAIGRGRASAVVVVCFVLQMSRASDRGKLSCNQKLVAADTLGIAPG
jgi:hypothetical protein